MTFVSNIQYLFRTHDHAVLPKRATAGSFGYDLTIIETATIKPHAVLVVQTGLRLGCSLPCEHEWGTAMMILPRSSLALKHGVMIVNSPGLIDADYTGDIGVILLNFTDEERVIQAGTRVAQAVFVEVRTPQVCEISGQTQTGSRGGFGSTGE
jgi:dUTP pyrophosphatase